MGKKKTTNVNQTGLGDGQFDTLSGNQQALATTLDEQNVAAGIANDALLSGQTNIQTGVNNLQTSQTAGFDAGATAAENARLEAIEREKRILAGISAQPTVDLTGLETGISGLGASVDTGFENMGGRFDTVDTNLATANKGIVDANTGITTLTEGQKAMQGDITSGFATSAENQANLTQGQLDYYTKAETDRANLKKAVLEGQVTIQDLVNKYGADGAKYYEALAGVQSQLMEGQSGLQTGLTNFQDQYTQDFQNQGKFLGELKQSVTGGFDTTNKNLGETTGALGKSLGTVNTNIGNLGTSLGNTLSSGFSGVTSGQLTADQLQAGFENNAMEDFNYGQIATDIYEATYGLATGSDVAGGFDEFGNEVIGRFDEFGNEVIGGFDEFGNKVQGGFDEFGNSVAGKFDEFGNELIGEFDEFGNKVNGGFDEFGNKVNGGFDEFGNKVQGRFDEFGNEVSGLGGTVGGYIDEMGKFIRADISQLEVTTADGQKVLAGQIADGTTLIDGSVKEGNRILSADQVKMRDAFVTKLDQVNNIVTSQDSQLSTELRQQYQNLSKSFDEKGSLISESVDENGIRTNRAIDKQGNLILAQFDQQGKRISQSSMNINDLIKGLDQGPRYNAGTNYQMGSPSPAYNERYGLMGPYTSTAGAPQYGTTPPRAANTQGSRPQFTPLAGGQ
jgi:Flp pilus assembly pilin Flp